MVALMPRRQLGTVVAGAVRLVGQDALRAGPGPAGPKSRHPDAVEHAAELRAVAGLPGGDQHRQRTLPLFAGQLQFRAQPAA
jgi:hypothetical protein